MADVTASVIQELPGLSRAESDPISYKLVTFAGPASYTTDGDALLGTGLEHIIGVIPVNGGGGYMLQWIESTQLLQWLTGDYDPAADSPFVQADNAADLSGVSVKALVLGYGGSS
jgi:hypothetical protein